MLHPHRFRADARKGFKNLGALLLLGYDMEKMSEIFIRRVDEWLKESEYRDIDPKYDTAVKYVAGMPKEESDLQQLLEDIERNILET